MKRRRKSLILGIILILFGIGIGYAFLTTDLNITGIAEVDSNTWNIYWDNVQVMGGSVDADIPVIDTNKTTVSFSVHLSKPGDFYEFTVDAKNDGSIDGMIDVIAKTINDNTVIPDYIVYNVSYIDDIEIAKYQLLKANTKETYKVRVEYNADINKSDLPSSSQSLNVNFGVTYIQADTNAVDVPHPTVVYTANTNYGLLVGQAIPNNVTQYSSFEEASARYTELFNVTNYHIALKHILKDEIVEDSYVVFSYPEIKSGIYELRGFDGYSKTTPELCNPGYFDSTINVCRSPYYENNKAILLEFFGSENCRYNDYDIDCIWNDSFQAKANQSGNVAVRINNNWYAQVFYEGALYVNGPF